MTPPPPSTSFTRATDSASQIRSILTSSTSTSSTSSSTPLTHPRIAIVCGSGLGGLASTINASPRVEITYADVPNFPVSTVQGHAGKLVFGTMGSEGREVGVVLLVGRAQEIVLTSGCGSFYEGHTMDLVSFTTRVCKVLGVETMIVTNAAGGINPDYAVGDIMMLNDHLNLPGLAGISPLVGPNADDFGVRFPPLSDAYDLELRRRVHKMWKEIGLHDGKRRLHEGTYAFAAGPSFETRAECRMLRIIGADVVGMSTVPEIVVARHCNMRVLAFSLVTNNVVSEASVRGDDPAIQDMSKDELKAYLETGSAAHAEVLEAGREASEDMIRLVKRVVEEL
ncbi:purine nucleoside phosphorylase 1 [Aulographum hederae CBS 113979]|uniref:purine-nucleoside phosphorylase n=1 Tax=Aulographum hederae CBS 113979 TaxID=1176131 RepID=A0A6G1GY87_9PEZI|nr:purine nucleoside phosphorylase 1 [Aulographum hederae CBS 113979]